MTNTERKPVLVKGIPSQGQLASEERRLPPRPAEFIAMDRFWDEVVPACRPFYANNREFSVPVSDDRLFRPRLSALFDIGGLSRLADSSQTGSTDESTDTFGVVTRISVGRDGTLHISKYLPGIGSARDTVDVFYKNEYPFEKLKVETREHVKREEDDIVPVERYVTFFFNTHPPEVQTFGYEYEIGYTLWGNDNNQKDIRARFIEVGEEVWGEISENGRQ